MIKKYLTIAIIALIALTGLVLLFIKNKDLSQNNPTQNYAITSDSLGKVYTLTSPQEYSFSIVDERGAVVKDFAVTHTKKMHVIIVRKDLAEFQHVHPDFNESTGLFTLKDVMFASSGEYRIFADFALGTKEVKTYTLHEDIDVGTKEEYKFQSLGVDTTIKNFGTYQVTLGTHGELKTNQESMLMFKVTEQGKPITDLEEYLGARGHVVILREGTLDFIHAHPVEATDSQNGGVDFMVSFPQVGKYKVFAQFQKGGKVFTTNFVVNVSEGVHKSGEMDMSGMDHMTH